MVLRALADPTRRAVVERLAKSPAVVSELAAPFSMALPSLMQRLRVLETAGLITSEKHGRVRTVGLRPGSPRRPAPLARRAAHPRGAPGRPTWRPPDPLPTTRRKTNMTRVRIDLFSSLDGFSSTTDQTAENPMGEDWGRARQPPTAPPAPSASASWGTPAAPGQRPRRPVRRSDTTRAPVPRSWAPPCSACTPSPMTRSGRGGG